MFTVGDLLQELKGLPLELPVMIGKSNILYVRMNLVKNEPQKIVIVPEGNSKAHSNVESKIPSYYNSGSYDVFDIANRYNLDMPLGTAIKYIVRAGRKDEAKHEEDLEKAIQCLNRELELIRSGK